MANKLNYNFKNLPDESGDSVSAEWLNEVQKGHNEGVDLDLKSMKYHGVLPNGNLNNVDYLNKLKIGFYLSASNSNLTNKPSDYAFVQVMNTDYGQGNGDGLMIWYSYPTGETYKRVWTSSGTISNWSSFLTNTNTIDRVIDEVHDKDGGWEKWDSGKLIQWGSVHSTTTLSVPWGGGVESESKQMNFHIPFLNAPQTVQIEAVNPSFASTIFRYEEASQHKTGRFTVWRPTSGSVTANFKFSYYAIGRWK